jgi:hypothetical protein
MVKLEKSKWKFNRFEKSKTKGKMYDAIHTSREDPTKERKISFGDNKLENYSDKTGLNAYPKLVHGDKQRRRQFRQRFSGLKQKQDNWRTYYTPLYYSWKFLW